MIESQQLTGKKEVINPEEGESLLIEKHFSYIESLILNLTPISRNILFILLNENAPITTSKIGRRLGISARSVQYRIKKEITNLSKELHLILENKPNYGVSIHKTVENKKSLLHKLLSASQKTNSLSKEQRRNLIILNVIFSESPVNVDKLVKLLNRSRGTIFNDLNSIRKNLLQNKLELIWHKNKGYFISGNEINIRETILHLLFKVFPTSDLLNYCKENWDKDSSSPLIELNFNNSFFYLHKYPLRYYWDLIYFCEKQYHFNLNDVARIELSMYLCLIIHRNLYKHNIDVKFQKDYSSIREEFIIGKQIVDQLEKKHQINLGQSESAYLALKLQFANQKRFGLSKNTSKIPSSNEIHEVVKEIINYASQYLHPCLKTDQELFNGLCDHFETSINRIRNKLFINNPYLHEIQNQYQYIFQISKLYLNFLKDKIDVEFPDDEIGFVSMQFAAAMERLHLNPQKEIVVSVICEEDSSVLIFMLARIRAEFPNIHIKSTFTVGEIRRELINNNLYDLVLSTIPINFLDLPFVVISPFINKRDKTMISETISRIEKRKDLFEEPKELSQLISLSDVLTEDAILFDYSVNSWQEAILLTCQILETKKDIESSYTEAIQNILLEKGPYMVIWPYIALLHAKPCDGAINLSIGMAQFNKPIHSGHQSNDPVYTAFVIATTDKTSHLRILYELSKICTDKHTSQILRSAKSKKEILAFINKKCQVFKENNYH